MQEEPSVARRPTVAYPELMELGRLLLLALGEDPEREGLRETPRRFADMWREFIEFDPGETDTTFSHVVTDQMIVVSGIRVWSMCEHHLLPFWCEIAIGYITRQKLLGLSKFARLAHAAAHRLQVQEQLCEEVAVRVAALVDSPDVAVLAQGEHLCMSMRGIRTPGLLSSSIMRGVFYEQPAARDEFLRLVALAGQRPFLGS